jgi:hypothetical protein
MKTFRRTALMIAVLAAPIPVFADGLIQTLPKDGAKVVYEMKANKSDANSSRDFTGTISIASVGTETVDNEKCRWIEIAFTMKFDGKSRKVISKMLITESDLGKGKIPLANIKRAWLKMRDKTEKLEDVFGRKGGPLPAFLPGPLKDVKKSTNIQIETTAIGRLRYRVLTGKTSYVQGSTDRKDEFKVEYDLRVCKGVPFGVARAKITIKEYVRKMKLDDTITLELKLRSVTNNAKSELPNDK